MGSEQWKGYEAVFGKLIGMRWECYARSLFNLSGQRGAALDRQHLRGADVVFGHLATDTILVATTLVLNADLPKDREARENLRDRRTFDTRRIHVPRCYYIDTWEAERTKRMYQLRKGAFRKYFRYWGCEPGWLDAMAWHEVDCEHQGGEWECGLLSMETVRVMLRENSGAELPGAWAKFGWQRSRLIRTPDVKRRTQIE